MDIFWLIVLHIFVEIFCCGDQKLIQTVSLCYSEVVDLCNMF